MSFRDTYQLLEFPTFRKRRSIIFQGKMFLHPSAGAAGSTMDFRRAVLRGQSDGVACQSSDSGTALTMRNMMSLVLRGGLRRWGARYNAGSEERLESPVRHARFEV